MSQPLSQSHFPPDDIVSPGETLRETLELFGMTQTELAQQVGVPRKTITAIIHGKAPLTEKISSQLAQLFGTPASFWTNLERNYRQALAQLKRRAPEIKAPKVS